MSEYKVEMKPTIWVVSLESGEYSDWDIDHYYIRANTEEEAWFLFKKYWVDVVKTEDLEYSRHCLVYRGEQFAPYPSSEQRWPRDEWNFDTDYGDASLVEISALNLIEFKR